MNALSIVLAVATLLVSASAAAYPWTIKHGYGGCRTCHADPSGGELLTRYGRVQGDLLLRMHYTESRLAASASETEDGKSFGTFEEEWESGSESHANVTSGEKQLSDTPLVEPNPGVLWGVWDPPEPLLLGGSYRHMTIYQPAGAGLVTFPMQADLYGQLQLSVVVAGGSLGLTRVRPGSVHGQAALVTRGEGTNLLSRTHWVGLEFSNGSSLLRAGRINLPFGVRVPEHVLWAREATRTDRESDQQHGVAYSHTGEAMRGEVMLVAGNYQLKPDRFRERGYSMYLEGLLSPRNAIGISSLMTRAEQDRITLDRESMTRQAHGVFSRLTLAAPLVLLTELDLLLKTGRDAGYVGVLQLDYEPIQGLHLSLTGELLDEGFRSGGSPGVPVQRTPGFGAPRRGGWVSVEWFCLPQVDVRLDLLARQGEPSSILAQLHVYL